MSSGVRIPIQADASQTLQAIEAIRAALRAAGADGASLANIDLSNLGSKDLARDLERALANLRDLTRIGRGDTAAAARKVFGSAPNITDLFSIEEAASRMFPEPAARQRFISNVTRHALRGTSFDPTPPEPPEPPPPPSPSPNPGGNLANNVLKSLRDGLMTGVGFVLANAGIGSVVGAANAALRGGEAENENSDRLLRRTNDLTMSFEQLRKEADYFHKGLLVSRIDFERYAVAFGSSAGSVTPSAAMKGARLAAGEAVAYGADPGSFASRFGQASFLGVAPDKFAEMIAEASVRGNMGGRIEDVLGALLHWTESASRVSATQAALTGSTEAFTGLYAAMNASGSPALRGANGLGVIDSINSSIMQGGGGGMAGQVLVMRALMGAGVTDPYQAQMQLAGGAFARIGKGGRTNFDVIMGELQREYRGMDRDGTHAALAGSQLFGINPVAMRALMGAGNGRIDFAGLDESLKPYGGINGISPTSLPDILKAQTADFDTLQRMARTVRRNSHLSGANANDLDSARGVQELRRAVISSLAQSGMPETDQTRAVDATNKLADAMATLGRTLVSVMTPLKDKIGDLATAATPIADWAARQLQPAETADDADVKFGKPGPGARGTFPGANRDWPTVGLGNGAPVPLPQYITASNSLLARIGQQESGLGTNPAAHGNIYGVIGSTWASDLRQMARGDKDIANLVSGMSDGELNQLKDMNHIPLQKKVAAFHLAQIRRALGPGASDMDLYASYTFGTGAGPHVMGAGDSTPLSQILSAETIRANPEYAHMTVGAWKAARRSLFPDTTNTTSNGSGTIKLVKPEALRVIIQDAKGKVHSQHAVELDTAWGDPAPSGAGPAPWAK